MGDIAAFGAGGLLRRRAAITILAGLLVAGCTPDYNWRDTRAPGGEYLVQLPAKPATMTRRIHLESAEVDMTMQGAKVRESAFTIGLVPLPAGAEGGVAHERILAAMREQMLRNIGASPAVPLQTAGAAVVDGQGRKTGSMQLQAISATGVGRYASIRLLGRFGLWRGRALQIVAVGPDLDPEQAAHFLDSLKLVEP